MKRSTRRFGLALAATCLAISGVSSGAIAGAGSPSTAEPQPGGAAVFLNYSEVQTLDSGRARSSTGGGQLALVPIYDLLAEGRA